MIGEEELGIHRCCIAGTRPEELCCCEAAAKHVLEDELRRAVDGGFRTFITGMSRGVDLRTGQIVLRFRGMNLDVKLVAVPPYRGWRRRGLRCGSDSIAISSSGRTLYGI